MAASMLDVKILQHAQTFAKRNACRLCSRSYSSERSITEEPKDVQITEGSGVVLGKRNVDQQSTNFSGQQPFWEQTTVPMWKSAYEKLKIQPSNVAVPTVNHRGVNIPRKVKRDHLTILTALAETTQLDDPNVNYNFNDDPRLQFPVFKDDCKKYNLEGRKTAHEMMTLYQEAFTDFKATPDIPDFNPVTHGYADKTLSVNALQERIERRQVLHAIEIYDRLEEKGEELPLEVEEKLIELICVYNGKNPKEKMPAIPSVYGIQKNKEPSVVWNGNTADKIFQKHNETGTLTPYMYNVYICGLLKYSQKTPTKKSVDLYREMKKKEIPVYLCTYNLLLEKSDLEIKDLLEDMKKDGLVPSKQTYSMLYNRLVESSLLKECIAEKYKSGFDLDFEDMRACYYIGQTDLPFLEKLVDYMASKKTWYLDHPGENVFSLIMKECKEMRRPEALPIAKKLYNLRNDMGIRYKISDYKAEKTFYSDLFEFVLHNAPFDYFTKLYKEVVPFYVIKVNFKKVLNRMAEEKVPGDFLINLYEDAFNFLPANIDKLSILFKDLEGIFTAMSAEQHSTELKKEFAERAHFFFTEYVQFEMPLKFQRHHEKMCNMLVSSNATLICLRLMLEDSSFLDKSWDCYMDYTMTTNKFLRKQTISWEPIMWRVIEVEDKVKIKQFLNKLKTSSSWVDCSFLPQMKEPLERILEADDRATLDFVLGNLPKK